MAVWDTRVRDYQAFCDERGWEHQEPKFIQTENDPVVNVSWRDAQAFCEWLSAKEGRKYRLPTDHEWSCAAELGEREDAGAGAASKSQKIADVYPQETQWPPPNDSGNFCGMECSTPVAFTALKGADVCRAPERMITIKGYRDGYIFTSPVGCFKPNGFGLYDMGGNVRQLCEDKYHPGNPVSRSASLDNERTTRGSCFLNGSSRSVLSANRIDVPSEDSSNCIGFRVVFDPPR